MSSETGPVTEFAPAKLNLYLHVLGRDQRGYHLLDSLVVFADFGDTITVQSADRLFMEITGPFGHGLEADAGNLAWKAAQAMSAIAGRPASLFIQLTKNLPVASGIGGGSSDAAAVLRGLCRLWDLDVSGEPVMQAARALGSDVPVCLAAQSRFMGGVGDLLDPCPTLPRCSVLMVNPGMALPTRDVFEARQGPFAPSGRFDVTPGSVAELAHILSQRGNGLATAAVSLQPAIETVLERLEQQPGCLLSRMMGSGATCLGLFGTEGEAEAAAMTIKGHHPEWWVQPAHIGG